MSDADVATPNGPPRVHLLCGLVGAGKTTYASRLATELPAVKFSLDEWMLRLFDLHYDDPRYVSKLDNCTSLIWDTAKEVLRLGHDVVLDWNQWSIERRRAWRDRVRTAGYREIFHYVDVSLNTAIRQTSVRRAKNVFGAHHVDEATVRHFATIFQPPTPDEGIDLVTVSGRPVHTRHA